MHSRFHEWGTHPISTPFRFKSDKYRQKGIPQKTLIFCGIRMVLWKINSYFFKYDLGNDGRDWGVGLAQQDLQKNYPGNGHYFKVALRPFDLRYSFYTGNSSGFIKCCRDKVSREMIGHKNLAFVLTRNAMPQKPYSNFLVVDTCVVGRFIGDFTTSTQVFPVFTFSEQFGKEVRHVNMASEQIARIEKALGLKFAEEDGVFPNSFTVMDLVGYIYAYLNSWKYRNEFKEVMCRDFPGR